MEKRIKDYIKTTVNADGWHIVSRIIEYSDGKKSAVMIKMYRDDETVKVWQIGKLAKRCKDEGYLVTKTTI